MIEIHLPGDIAKASFATNGGPRAVPRKGGQCPCPSVEAHQLQGCKHTEEPGDQDLNGFKAQRWQTPINRLAQQDGAMFLRTFSAQSCIDDLPKCQLWVSRTSILLVELSISPLGSESSDRALVTPTSWSLSLVLAQPRWHRWVGLC